MKLKLISCILLFSTIFAFANELDLNDFEEEYQSYKVNDPLYGYNKAMTSFNV
ncbi:VacJ family lipoprotein, partial [Campylobacter jejuni]|nr:VacJ family lipoprotein [Campylobacter jejuni]